MYDNVGLCVWYIYIHKISLCFLLFHIYAIYSLIVDKCTSILQKPTKIVLVEWVATLQAKVWNASSAAPVVGDYL